MSVNSSAFLPALPLQWKETPEEKQEKNLTAEFIQKERGDQRKTDKESQIAQTASFVCSTTMMASRFHWNNLFTSYLPMLKLFTQKKQMRVDQKFSGVFLSPESGRAKETEAYDRYVKTK